MTGRAVALPETRPFHVISATSTTHPSIDRLSDLPVACGRVSRAACRFAPVLRSLPEDIQLGSPGDSLNGVFAGAGARQRFPGGHDRLRPRHEGRARHLRRGNEVVKRPTTQLLGATATCEVQPLVAAARFRAGDWRGTHRDRDHHGEPDPQRTDGPTSDCSVGNEMSLSRQTTPRLANRCQTNPQTR